jgi:S-DNA-T family DNA segregation ATPase FtsK/SpoIIIE
VVELSIYKDIPNLLCRVVTDTKKAIATLTGMVEEMNARYEELDKLGARNIQSYNAKSPDKLPYIVIVIDEVADLMMEKEDGKEIETSIQRLAQKARAAGIHLIVATQRPSVDAIKGTIKSNLPTRISFLMASAIDSRTILGEAGAEQLLGEGDMLYQTTGGKLTRAHGAYVGENEVEDAVRALKKLGKPDYQEFDVEEGEVDLPRRGKRLSDARERVRHQIDLLRGEWTSTDLIRAVKRVTGASESIIKQEMRDHPRIRRDRTSTRANVPFKVTING